jgi:YMGG-like Gly-zipper
MKRLVALVISVAILAAASVPVLAQQRNCRRDSRTYSSRRYDSSRSYDSRGYYDNSGNYDNRSYYDYGYDNRSFWQRHRDKLTVAIGTGAGAALGAMLGGKRGAAIGAAAGAGSSALYTYRIRNRRYGY